MKRNSGSTYQGRQLGRDHRSKMQQQVTSVISPYCSVAGVVKEVKVALWEVRSALTGIEAASRRHQLKRCKEAQEHELKARMAEVDHKLLSARNKEDTDQHLIDIGTSIMQLEGAIKERFSIAPFHLQSHLLQSLLFQVLYFQTQI